jgi:hypothetical protein
MSDVEHRRARRFLVLQAAYELTGGDAHKQFRQQDVEHALGLPPEEVDALISYLKTQGLVSLHSLGGVYQMTDAGVTEYKTAVSRPAVPTRYFPAVDIIRTERMGQSQARHDTGTADLTGAVHAAARLAKESPNVPPEPDVSAPETTTETFDSALNDALVRESLATNMASPAVEPSTMPPEPVASAKTPTTAKIFDSALNDALRRESRPTNVGSPAVESSTVPPEPVGSARAQTTAKTFDFAVIDALVRDIRSANITLSPTDTATLDSDLATVEAQLKRPQPMRSIISESFGSARTIVERAGEDVLTAKIGHLLLEMAMWDFGSEHKRR